jgi:hyperosmotically inducible protein
MLLALALLTVVSARAAAQDAAELADAVAREIRGCAALTIFDHVDARLDAGTIVLSGGVTARSKRDEIERRVRGTRGVASVRNHIRVLPASVADDELRQRISKAIYNNPSFWTYAAMAHPPIHIIVEDGRVTLAGFVHNDVDRAIAGSLAARSGARSVTNDLSTVPTASRM